MSAVENQAEGWRDVLRECYAAPGDAVVIGVTGPPGSGKSSLIDLLASAWATAGHQVGVIAVDPSSPFSGGAVLGDRVRMRRSEDLDQVFIRSMSARGHAGGLNAAAADLCVVMSSHGATRILLETVGVGQNEIEVAFVADCTVVVAVPGLGDSLQAAKAGLLEVGDVYAVNKADLPGAEAVARDIRDMLALAFAGRPGIVRGDDQGTDPAALGKEGRDLLAARFGLPQQAGGAWHPPVVMASAAGADTGALTASIATFEAWARDSSQLNRRRRSRIDRQLEVLLARRLVERVVGPERTLGGGRFEPLVDRIARGTLDPHSAIDSILSEGATS